MTRKGRKFIIILLSILLVLTIGFTIFNSGITGLSVQNPEDNDSNDSLNIKTATFAICEPRENYTYCKDKIYAACNGMPIEVTGDSFTCNNQTFKVDNSNLGEIYLSNFSDPRGKDFITAWAVGG